ncbi:hypothetical protein K431DRAFT_286883 [Polychaeton citri CBS 116435]|uniref:DDE-1 domain-containing protein n=1 Tax=Polychaeton citri CBS 116435 TaxID=1314669 RepID=A0A9P4UM75_9PEZI|nr:hypothetical protein K431DRAFT_286883 [Polychaeton citri CBS 116435]
MEDFIAHRLAVDAIGTGLRNVVLFFLPSNVTPIYQPLGQGIIKKFKAYCHRFWLQHVLDQRKNGKKTLRPVNLSKVVR